MRMATVRPARQDERAHPRAHAHGARRIPLASSRRPRHPLPSRCGAASQPGRLRLHGPKAPLSEKDSLPLGAQAAARLLTLALEVNSASVKHASTGRSTRRARRVAATKEGRALPSTKVGASSRCPRDAGRCVGSATGKREGLENLDGAPDMTYGSGTGEICVAGGTTNAQLLGAALVLALGHGRAGKAPSHRHPPWSETKRPDGVTKGRGSQLKQLVESPRREVSGRCARHRRCKRGGHAPERGRTLETNI